MVALGLGLSIAAGVVFGIVPAIQVSGVNPGENLKDAGRGLGEGRRERRFRGALVAAEIAISLVLLVGAGLLVRSFWSMLQVNPGLDPARVGFAQIWIPVPNDPSKNPYGTPAQRNAYINEVLRRVGALPGVESVGMSASNRTPFSGSGVTQRFTFVGESTAPADVRRAQFQVASPEYFATLKSPILSGRAFTDGRYRRRRAGRDRQRHAREDAVSGQGSRRPQHLTSAASRSALSASSPTFTTMGWTCRWRRGSISRCSSDRTTR